MSTGNPIWDAHDDLWGLLEDVTNVPSLKVAGKHFDDLVKNHAVTRLKAVTDTRSELFAQVESTGDFPKVALLHKSAKPKDRRASNSDSLTLQWEVWVRTNDQRLTALTDLEWAIFRQLLNWDSLKTSVVWNGVTPVTCCDLKTAEDSIFSQEMNNNLRGWSAVWVGQTDMWFSHASLIA